MSTSIPQKLPTDGKYSNFFLDLKVGNRKNCFLLKPQNHGDNVFSKGLLKELNYARFMIRDPKIRFQKISEIKNEILLRKKLENSRENEWQRFRTFGYWLRSLSVTKEQKEELLQREWKNIEKFQNDVRFRLLKWIPSTFLRLFEN